MRPAREIRLGGIIRESRRPNAQAGKPSRTPSAGRRRRQRYPGRGRGGKCWFRERPRSTPAGRSPIPAKQILGPGGNDVRLDIGEASGSGSWVYETGRFTATGPLGGVLPARKSPVISTQELAGRWRNSCAVFRRDVPPASCRNAASFLEDHFVRVQRRYDSFKNCLIDRVACRMR
jgi:hypothetical protein